MSSPHCPMPMKRREGMKRMQDVPTPQPPSVTLATERQQSGIVGFARASWTAGWLAYRNLRYYPSNLALAGVQQLTAIGVWYFVGRFLNAGASQAVRQFGAN